METKTFITVATEFTGFHQWPGAPTPVAFLRDLHRHIFGVKLSVYVNHGDREVEFFMLKKELDTFIAGTVLPCLGENHSMSCEHLAGLILSEFNSREYSVKEVTVDEDGQNSATIEVYANTH
jgi:hypothetical protein